jgi:hypothetical protein
MRKHQPLFFISLLHLSFHSFSPISPYPLDEMREKRENLAAELFCFPLPTAPKDSLPFQVKEVKAKGATD